MIIMGAGICQWFHGDATYRAVLALLLLTGSMGRNGGGWAHYVGQEKAGRSPGGRPWRWPPTGPGRRARWRHLHWYAHTDQWRYDGYRPTRWPAHWAAAGSGKHTMDAGLRGGDGLDAVLSAIRPIQPRRRRRGAQRRAGRSPSMSPSSWRQGPAEARRHRPDDPANWPRVLDVWRANLLGSSSKGNEYFLRHLLGTTSNVQAGLTPEALRPNDVAWPDDVPGGQVRTC